MHLGTLAMAAVLAVASRPRVVSPSHAEPDSLRDLDQCEMRRRPRFEIWDLALGGCRGCREALSVLNVRSELPGVVNLGKVSKELPRSGRCTLNLELEFRALLVKLRI